jgi:hypothetical protein
MHWLLQTEPVKVSCFDFVVQSTQLRYQKQVVLNKVILEVFEWQCSIRKTSHETMLDVIVPYGSDITSLQKVLDESAPIIIMSKYHLQMLEVTYGGNGNVKVEWK